MRQSAVGIGIAFTAMDLVSVKTESIIETLAFPAGFFHKLLTQRLKRVEFAVLNFEVRYDLAKFVLCAIVGLSGTQTKLDHPNTKPDGVADVHLHIIPECVEIGLFQTDHGDALTGRFTPFSWQWFILPALNHYPSALVGSMIRLTSEIVLAGKPPSFACFSINSLLGAT